jgi:hypothetical protein
MYYSNSGKKALVPTKQTKHDIFKYKEFSKNPYKLMQTVTVLFNRAIQTWEGIRDHYGRVLLVSTKGRPTHDKNKGRYKETREYVRKILQFSVALVKALKKQKAQYLKSIQSGFNTNILNVFPTHFLQRNGKLDLFFIPGLESPVRNVKKLAPHLELELLNMNSKIRKRYANQLKRTTRRH